MDTNDSVRTNVFDCPRLLGESLYISISPNLDYIATKDSFKDLCLYNLHTGKILAAAESWWKVLGFTPDGHVVLCAWVGEGHTIRVNRWKITGDGTPDVTKLESLGSTKDPPEGTPWRSSHGYQVADDGWMVNSGKKRLLWLPHHWRSGLPFKQMWSGKFLALLHSGLPEAVVLELEL